MFSFFDSKTSSAKLSEWSPSDWPESLAEMRTIDNLLRCSICYEFFNVALMIPDCSHNYCSLCIRRSLSYEAQCPTCSSKVNPPSLRNNRVLDELVKNFVQVRTKLLELVRGNSDSGQSVNRDSKAGQQDKDKINSNAKRRKLSARPSIDPKSSSSHFKRQKLNIEDDVHLLTSSGNETDDSNTGMTAEAVEVVSVMIQGRDVHGQEPVMEDKYQSSQKTNPSNSDIVECPVCGELVEHSKINSHVDVCLTRTEKKRALRSKKNPSKSKSNKSIKTSGLLSLLPPQGSQGSSGENVQPSGVVKESCSSAASTSSSTVKGSNALIQPVQKRKPLPKLVYSVMAEKELRQRLKEWNLSTKGDKSTLIKRHQDFVLLYNVQCDSAHPMTAAQVANEVEQAERKRSVMASSTVESSATALHFNKDQSEEDMDKARQKYLSENQREFSKLIADVKRRRGRERNLSEKNTVTKMPEEGTRKPVQVINQQDTPECSQNKELKDTGETTAIPKKSYASYASNNSNADFAGYPPIVHRKDNEAKNAETFETSIVPEPPSSPNLALFEEEEDELTPSLGLDDREWDEEADEGSDDNVIPESPVIKVGKRSDEIADRHSRTSESDEEFHDHQSFPSNKTVKPSLF